MKCVAVLTVGISHQNKSSVMPLGAVFWIAVSCEVQDLESGIQVPHFEFLSLFSKSGSLQFYATRVSFSYDKFEYAIIESISGPEVSVSAIGTIVSTTRESVSHISIEFSTFNA